MHNSNFFTDKEVLEDGLSAQKASTEHFNTYAGECVHDDLRHTMMEILEQEHCIQNEVFQMMHKRGFYQTPAAEEKKVAEAKQKFSQSFQ